MGPQRFERLLRIFFLFGVGLPAAPTLLGFPHDARYCSDIRVGDDVCQMAGLFFLVVTLFGRCATFSRMTPSQRGWLVPKAIGAGLAWFFLPFAAGFGVDLLQRM